MKKHLLLLAALVLMFRMSGQSYLKELNTRDEFEKLAGLPLTAKYGQVSAVKVVYNLKNKQLYFINSKYFKYHHEFCSAELSDESDLTHFNKVNYSKALTRNYLLANVNYFKTINKYALEIAPVDLMSTEELLSLYQIINEKGFWSDQLHLFLNSTRLLDLQLYFELKMPVLRPEDVYSQLNYQAIGKHKGCGVVKFVDLLKEEASEAHSLDILVINKTPLYLPNVAGIIVSEFQTPLSHLSLLAQNRKIPVAAYKPAFNAPYLLKLNNQKVCLEVKADTFLIERIDHLNHARRQTKRIVLKSDLAVDSIVDIAYVDRKSYKYAGNKASNFGILYQLSQKNDFRVPECAFVIPFLCYQQHLEQCGANKSINNLLNDNTSDTDSIKQALKSIRKQITSFPVDTTLMASINGKVRQNGLYKRFRFRSSTNAEDARGFSGAGLYSSKTGILDDEEKSFEKAIKQVWASLWSFDAYMERELFSINHTEVYMGILAHRSFPDEKVNGVAITKNLYRPDAYGFVVNAQLGEESVVKPREGIMSDQFICYPDGLDNLYKNKNTVDIITQSNLSTGGLIMTDDEIVHLANQLENIKRYYATRRMFFKPYLDVGLDLEFKLDSEERVLYIKQMREYND